MFNIVQFCLFYKGLITNANVLDEFITNNLFEWVLILALQFSHSVENWQDFFTESYFVASYFIPTDKFFNSIDNLGENIGLFKPDLAEWGDNLCELEWSEVVELLAEAAQEIVVGADLHPPVRGVLIENLSDVIWANLCEVLAICIIKGGKKINSKFLS